MNVLATGSWRAGRTDHTLMQMKNAEGFAIGEVVVILGAEP